MARHGTSTATWPPTQARSDQIGATDPLPAASPATAAEPGQQTAMLNPEE